MYELVYEEDFEMWRVRNKETGWFFPVNTKVEGETLVEEFNKTKEPKSIEDFFNEWEKAINELKDKSVELINLKESYNQMEQDIVENTDFKELYGANNQKVRDNHVKNELKDMVDAKHDLELRIEYLKRRIDFIKNVLTMQRVLIESGAV